MLIVRRDSHSLSTAASSGPKHDMMPASLMVGLSRLALESSSGIAWAEFSSSTLGKLHRQLLRREEDVPSFVGCQRGSSVSARLIPRCLQLVRPYLLGMRPTTAARLPICKHVQERSSRRSMRHDVKTAAETQVDNQQPRQNQLGQRQLDKVHTLTCRSSGTAGRSRCAT
jgi:hypothetical protein